MGQVTISRELLLHAIEFVGQRAKEAHSGSHAYELFTALRNALEQPAVEPSAVFYRCNHCWHGYEDQPPSSCDCSTGYGFERVEYFTSPQAQQPPRIGSGVTVEQTLEQWEHDFNNPMTPEQQTDWVNREREFAARQAQQPRKAVKLTTDEYTALAHRIASKYTHRSDPAFTGYTFLPHTLEQFVRAIEQAVWEKLGVTE